MHPQRKKRLLLLVFIISGMTAAVGLALYALGQNINLYYTPSQLLSSHVSPRQELRIGGLVKNGSVNFAKQGLQMSFVLTDNHHDVTVNYNGVLPALFREGQGIVVEGKLNSQGVLIADQVLAKHDNNYRPPGIQQ